MKTTFASNLTGPGRYVSWGAQVIAAAILLQTLFFKFTGAEESIYIFTQVGIEPWGRYLTGSAELVAGVLLLIPALAWLGAALAIGIMAGAIGAHLFTPLGIAVQPDPSAPGDPSLFVLALVVTVLGFLILFLRRGQVLALLGKSGATGEPATNES